MQGDLPLSDNGDDRASTFAIVWREQGHRQCDNNGNRTGDRPLIHMRRVLVVALAALLGMCLGAAVSETRLRTVFMLSEASHISHGAAAARLLFGFTLDPLTGLLSSNRVVSYSQPFRFPWSNR
jgi:hypothetical protein